MKISKGRIICGVVLTLLILTCTEVHSDDWAEVRAKDIPQLTEEWEKPVRQPVSLLGWIESVQTENDETYYLFWPGDDLHNAYLAGTWIHVGPARIYTTKDGKAHELLKGYGLTTGKNFISDSAVHKDANGDLWYNSNREGFPGGRFPGVYITNIYRNGVFMPFNKEKESPANPEYCAAKDILYFDCITDKNICVMPDAAKNGFNGSYYPLPFPINYQSKDPKVIDMQPHLSDDCNTLYFNSTRGPDGKYGKKARIHKTELQEDGTWSTPTVYIEGEVHIGDISISPDGQRMCFSQWITNGKLHPKTGNFHLRADLVCADRKRKHKDKFFSWKRSSQPIWNGLTKKSLHKFGWEGDPDIIHENDIFHMLFTTNNITKDKKEVLATSYALSVNGFEWFMFPEKTGEIVHQSIKPTGQHNEKGIENPSVIRVPSGKGKYGDKYYTYYTANGQDDIHRIGLATSIDGYKWTDRGVVLEAQRDWEGPYCHTGTCIGGVLEPSVIYDNGTFKMWYVGLGYDPAKKTAKPPKFYQGYARVGYATSTDGVTWVRQNNEEPVLQPYRNRWDDAVISHIDVVYDAKSKGYYMIYMGRSDALEKKGENDKKKFPELFWDPTPGLGIAYSEDGITWEKDYDNNPVIPKLASEYGPFGPTIITDGKFLGALYGTPPELPTNPKNFDPIENNRVDFYWTIMKLPQ